MIKKKEPRVRKNNKLSTIISHVKNILRLNLTEHYQNRRLAKNQDREYGHQIQKT
jgi:hypothetical protein